MKKVFIQYNCIAHYRTRIFELLSHSKSTEFTIIADNEPDIPFLKTFGESESRFIRTKYSKNYKLNLPKLPEIYFQPKTIYYIIRERPDCLISLGTIYSLTSWASLLTAKLLGIPCIIWGHGLLEEEKGLKWFMRKAFYNLADAQLLYGNYAKNLLIDKGFAEEKLFVVYNSLDFDSQVEIEKSITPEQIERFKAENNISFASKLLVFTGRLQPVKKLDQLIKTTALLNENGVDTHLAFIGDGQLREFLEQLATDNKIRDKVHFLGASYDEAFIGLVFKASDLCIIPSGAGLTIMHAMVYGTPVLLSDNLAQHFPEWEAVEEGKTGFYYKTDDIIDMVNKAKEVLQSDKKSNIRQNCLKVIQEKYNPYVQEKVFEAAVNSVTEKI
ncbi:glycosyltransferase [Methylomonas methanica]|uniref:Glycosyl transferase group 1 n=1 Tax=Methylomonas methanica (strain DSM 25384 / MC09) TaxID=857087 RepID=G0A1G3_METMM|nr:glycosyltransferase [Methylomonas methanica]AEF98856.1 glycosyl transferase group 1 [Methylomonas methanica MC09]